MEKYLFVDIDGTLAEWRAAAAYEELFEENYFLSLAPHTAVVEAVKAVLRKRPELKVYIISAYLQESEYALDEKSRWLDRYLPEIPRAQRLFNADGSSKAELVGMLFGQFGANCFLLDDYSKNLHNWTSYGGTGIKLMNNVNGTNGTWNGPRVSFTAPPEELADAILAVIDGN